MRRLFKPQMFGSKIFKGMKWWKPLFGSEEGKEGVVVREIKKVFEHGKITSSWQGIHGGESFAGGYIYYEDDLERIQKTTSFKTEGDARSAIPKIRIELKRDGLLIGFRVELYMKKQKEWLGNTWRLIDKNVRGLLKIYLEARKDKIYGVLIRKKDVLKIQEKVKDNIILILKVLCPIFEEWHKHWEEEAKQSQRRKFGKIGVQKN